MRKHNECNERIKHKYLNYLKEAMRNSEATVDGAAKALSRFEEYTGYRDFKNFRVEQAVAFKRYLALQNGQQSGKKLSKATLFTTLNHLKRFFHWLAGQNGFKSRISFSDSDYFNLSEKESRVARAYRDARVPSVEEIRCVIDHMPEKTEIERRNRALVAFTVLTGARNSAIVSLKLKHIDLVKGTVYQDAREVNTKASKTINTHFFPVDPLFQEIFESWVSYLRQDKIWGDDDPLFPATEVGVVSGLGFSVVGLKRAHWQGTESVRKIFKDAFAQAGVPYCTPHSFRKTLTRFCHRMSLTPEQVMALSQNFGHESPLTTFTSYGKVPDHRQGEIIRELRNRLTVKTVNTEQILATAIEALQAEAQKSKASV